MGLLWRPRIEFRRQAARRQRGKTSSKPVRWRHETAMGSPPVDAALDWKGVAPNRTPGNEKQASSVLTFGGPTRPKKPVRRCFKSRSPLRAECAGFASGCRLVIESDFTLGRLSGLLSGCPPTDTRPQARAKLGRAYIGVRALDHKGILRPSREFFTGLRRSSPVASEVDECARGP